MNLARSADKDLNPADPITITLDELHEAVEWVLMGDDEIFGMMSMVWADTDANQDGSVSDEELKGLLDVIGGDMSRAE